MEAQDQFDYGTRCKQRQRIRHWGVSNLDLDDMLELDQVPGGRACSANQVYYSLQAREAEYEIVPACVDQGVGVLVWSPLAGGLLSGKYRRDQPGPQESRLLSGWDEPPVRDQDKLYDIVEVLVAVASGRGASPAQVALAWLLERPAVTSVIIGARTSEQLADNLGAADLSLTAEELARLEEVSRPPLLYPYWHQAKTAIDRLGPAVQRQIEKTPVHRDEHATAHEPVSLDRLLGNVPDGGR